MPHPPTQKVTADIPIDLLHKAQIATGRGITETLKIALTHFVHANAYDALRSMRSEVKFSIDLTELRKLYCNY